MSTTTSLSFFRPAAVKASASSAGKPDPNNRKNASSNWWTPIFGLSSEPDYINNPTTGESSESETEPAARSRSKYSLGCFTEEKAKQLRIKTAETETFHDIMYHSAIASRLASDISKPNGK